MPLDPAMVGRETEAESETITAEAVRQFADAIGDNNPVYRDAAAAERAGFAGIPALPTFVTRIRVSFAESGLDPTRSQVLHGEQEYEYTRPIVVGDTIRVRHRVASIRQSARAGNMAIMTIEQLGETPEGERVVTGRSTAIVRDATPGEQPAAGAASAASAAAKKAPETPQGEPIPALEKHVTQPQIDAYADVSGDHNPIHINADAARAVGLDGTIAHGMLSMAFLGQMLSDWLTALPDPGGWVARLRVRFQAMVRPGDTITCHGVLSEASDTESGRRRLEVWIDNQRGERIITGDADVALPRA
jgi:acyl dehydratase